MRYEEFKSEVYKVLKERDEPLTWNEIKAASSLLRQKAPYHVYVRKLQGDIGLVRIKKSGKRLWALREWFESGRFEEFLPERMSIILLDANAENAIVIGEDWELRRIYPVSGELSVWDVLEVEIEEFFPKDDKRPESMRVKSIKVTGRVEEDRKRLRIMERVAESGEFLHRDALGGKTLGVIKPRFRCFHFYDGRCEFYCDQSVCVGHDFKVLSDVQLAGERVYFLLEADENERDWAIRAVLSLSDPRQLKLPLRERKSEAAARPLGVEKPQVGASRHGG